MAREKNSKGAVNVLDNINAFRHLPQQYDDLRTVLLLWSKIDPTDRKAVLAFVKNILNPYVDILRNREGNRERSLDSVLLTEAELSGLNTMRPSFIQAVFQTIQTLEDVSGETDASDNVTSDGQLAYALLQNGNLRHFSEMVLYHGRKEQLRLPELLRTIITLPKEGIMTIEQLKERTEHMTEEEFKDFEISLNILAQNFEEDLKFPAFTKKAEDFGSNADKQQEAERIRKYQEAREEHKTNRLNHEAMVRDQYKEILQFKLKDGVEGTAAAEAKKVEVIASVAAAKKDPLHKRYDQLVYRHKSLVQETQSLANADRKLNVEAARLEVEANTPRSRRGTVLLRVAAVCTLGLALIPVAINSYLRGEKIDARRKEIAASRRNIAARETQIKQPLIAINKEMKSIRRRTCEYNPYIAYSDEELTQISWGVDKLCQVEASIQNKIVERRKTKVGMESIVEMREEAVAKPSERLKSDQLPDSAIVRVDSGEKAEQKQQGIKRGMAAAMAKVGTFKIIPSSFSEIGNGLGAGVSTVSRPTRTR